MPSALQPNCPCSPLLLSQNDSHCSSLHVLVCVCSFVCVCKVGKGCMVRTVRGSWHSVVCQDAVAEAVSVFRPRSLSCLQKIAVNPYRAYRVTGVRGAHLAATCACAWIGGEVGDVWLGKVRGWLIWHTADKLERQIWMELKNIHHRQTHNVLSCVNSSSSSLDEMIGWMTWRYAATPVQ